MTETKKKDITYIAGSNPYGQEETLITNIGCTASSEEKYEIYWRRILAPDGACPEIDSQIKEFYGSEASLQDLLDAAIRQLSTRPNYKLVGFDDDGALRPGGHEAMQEMANGYEIGRRSVATGGAKAKAKGFDALKAAAAEAGLDTTDPVAAMKALMEKAKEAGIL